MAAVTPPSQVNVDPGEEKSRLKPSQLLGNGIDRTDKSFQFTADFLAAIFTWGGIGWVADRALATAPVFMVLGFVVGNMAGIYLLYIRSRDGESMSQGVTRPDPPSVQADPGGR